METLPVALFVNGQSSPVWCTIVLMGVWIGICLGRAILVTWLSMILWPLRRLSLVLYLCTSCTLMVLPSYWCMSGDIIYVSYGMMCGAVWGGCLDSQPAVVVIISVVYTLWRGYGDGSGGNFMVVFLLSFPYVVFQVSVPHLEVAPERLAMRMEQQCWIWLIIFIMPQSACFLGAQLGLKGW